MRWNGTVGRITLSGLFAFALMEGAVSPLGGGEDDPGPFQWRQITEHAPFPGSYNFTLFEINNRLYAFHPAGVWRSSDGGTWKKTRLRNVLNDAFLDYVRFRGAVYALGTFEGNIEHFAIGSRISRTTDFRRWNVIAERSNLPRRYFYSSVVFRDRIWIMGGEYLDTVYHDVWNSDDGVHWKQVSRDNAWHSAGRGAVVFRNRIFLFSGGADRPVSVYSSADGVEWKVETDALQPEPFYGATPVVYENLLWLVGCNRSGGFSNEIVSSADGLHWSASRAPWSPRGGAAVAVVGKRLYMTGGKFSTGSGTEIHFHYSNDVWVMEGKKE